MRLSAIALVLFASSVALAEPEPMRLLVDANTAYQIGDYAKAAQGYRALVEGGHGSPDLLFNLGTAELRAGRRGHAILAYERALRVDPNDADVQYNLAEATKGNIDKVVGIRDEEPLVERIGARVPADAMAAAFLVAWVLGLGLLFLRHFVKVGRGVLLGAGFLSLVAAVACGALLATAWWHRSEAAWAVVVTPAAAVREGPAADFKSAFEIHEGLKVRVVKKDRGFFRVRLPNGSEGWVSGQDVPLI